MSATLSELLRAGVAETLIGDPRVVVTGVQHDSRQVVARDLFVAVQGEHADGAAFVDDARTRGAAAVVTRRRLPIEIPQLIARDPRRALGRAARIVYGDPTRDIGVVGITGTNGKTTTAWLLEAAIARAGGTPALMGTLGVRAPGIEHALLHTTPEADDVMRFARRATDNGATHLVMEVSSHGLALHRVDEVQFDVAAFTNLSQDHLDFHGDLESYGRAKAKLFLELDIQAAVLNVDDAFGARLAEQVAAREAIRTWRCSANPSTEAEVSLRACDVGASGTELLVALPSEEVRFSTTLVGAHNVENLLVALGSGVALGLPADRIAAGLSQSQGAPGRLERIAGLANVNVFVDYAHTPDALRRVLETVRKVTEGRVIAVFGCGGDRDRTKRALMGRSAGDLADIVVLTSDNPRSESPGHILDDIEPGIRSSGQRRIAPSDASGASRGYFVEADRRAAIELAISAARAGDTVLIAGKGHETYQIVGTERLHFDDREEASASIARITGAA